MYLTKLLVLQNLYISIFDVFWKYFKLISIQNRYTKTINISLSLYLYELLLLTASKQASLNNKFTAVKIPLLNLPIGGKLINNTLLLHIRMSSATYPPYTTKNFLGQTYFAIIPTLKLYTNLNFYYLKVYEH